MTSTLGLSDAGESLVVRLVQSGRHMSTDRYTHALACGFAARRTRVEPFTLAATRLGQIAGLERLDDYIRRWIRLPLAARRISTDVFHLADDNGNLRRWLPGERTITTCHDMIPLLAANGEIPYNGPRWYVERFRWGVRDLRRAAAIVCPSEATRLDVIRMCGVPEERVRVIPHGVSRRFAPLARERRAAVRATLGTGAADLVLHVGTGIFYKNVSATLEVLRLLRDGGYDVALVRAGAPLSADDRERCTTLGLSDHVHDVGRVNDERLVEVYNAADVFLFPSFAEGFGWPVVEAMACGTPVVASDIPALRELGEDAALYASPDDPLALADAVRSVLDDPTRAAALSDAGRARASRFAWETAIDAYEHLYREVAAAARG